MKNVKKDEIVPPQPAKKPKVETIQEKAMASFKKMLERGPVDCHDVEKSNIFGLKSVTKETIKVYTIEKWVEVTQYDFLMEIRLGKIIAFIKEHNITTSWLKIFEALVLLCQNLTTFKQSFDETPRTHPAHCAEKTTPTIVSDHSSFFFDWIVSLTDTIY